MKGDTKWGGGWSGKRDAGGRRGTITKGRGGMEGEGGRGTNVRKRERGKVGRRESGRSRNNWRTL